MALEDNIKETICSIEQLSKYIKLTPKEEKLLKKVIKKHPMLIPKYYLSLIDQKDKNDPIRKMIVPSTEELNLSGFYDTSGELENTKMPGLQHKYNQTVLILSTNQCSAYCRYCFRKRLVGLPSKEIPHCIDDIVEYIKKHEEINNVLISGGDPFMLSTKTIDDFLKKLSVIPHLDFIRFGSKVPVTFPDRLEDTKLLNLFKKYSPKKKIYVTTQFNHPREITKKSVNAINNLIKSNVIVNNQTVLLRGVNDSPDVLAELMNNLVKVNINPYYIFQCRPVKRVKHFQVPLCEGYRIVENAKKSLNGYSKRFRYVMSHRTGKIEIVGIIDNEMYFKYHQAKNPKNIGKLFKKKLKETATWLDDSL